MRAPQSKRLWIVSDYTYLLGDLLGLLSTLGGGGLLQIS